MDPRYFHSPYYNQVLNYASNIQDEHEGHFGHEAHDQTLTSQQQSPARPKRPSSRSKERKKKIRIETNNSGGLLSSSKKKRRRRRPHVCLALLLAALCTVEIFGVFLQPFGVKIGTGGLVSKLGRAFGTGSSEASIDSARGKSSLSASSSSKWLTCLKSIQSRQVKELSDIFDLHRNSTILLVDPAYTDCISDNLLVEGEHNFLHKVGWGSKIVECDVIQGWWRIHRCNEPDNIYEHESSKSKLAVWHGGGKWGDLYRKIEEERYQSFRKLLNLGYTVVTMPGSMFYQNETGLVESSETMRRIANETVGLTSEAGFSKERLILTWRQKDCYSGVL